MSDIFQKVREFLIQERWDYDFELKPETSLQNDLSIFGDDASEILNKFCNKFNIDYSNFSFDDYFKPESSWADFFSKKKEYKNLTIADLVKAIERGSL